MKKAQAMLRDPVAFADLLRRLHIPAGLTSRLRRIGVGDTHSVKADRFLDELSEQNSNLADYIRKLFSNEGLNPRQFKFIGFDTDITRGSHLAPRSFGRAMHGTETGDFTGEIPDMVKNPFGAIRSSKRMFAGDAKTLSAYGITSPVTGFLNDKYILRDRRGAPLMIEDTPLSKLVEKGLSKRVADIESRGVASSISSSPASGMRNTNSVGTGRTVRSYLLDRGLASPSRIPEVVRASEGAVDDLTHLRIAFPLNYVDGMSPRWDAGGGMLFSHTGSSGGKAFKPHIDPDTLQSTQDVAYDSIMKYIDNAMHKKASSSHPDFDKIVQAYRDRYGIDLSHMRMRWSKHPVYNNGKRSYELDDDEVGGSWVRDSTVRINPKMGPVMKRFGIDGMTQAEFRRRLIAHELAHEVWHNQSRKAKVKRLIRDSLAKAREENFTTPYLDTYPADTPKRKFDSELFAEYMSDQLNKKASDAKYSLKDDPTYEDVLKVFDKLDFDDRANLVPRHPDFIRKVPDDMLFDRQVAIDGDGNPVGFNEFYYGRNKLGRRQPPHNSIAVIPEARGNGLARLMVEAAVRKARKEKIRRLVWEAFADNEGSIRAALSAGFEDATPKNAKGYRRFVYKVSEKKASAKKETYESGEGEVESYTPDKTKDHDEIVIRLKDGRRVRISNNTRLGKALKPRKGDSVGYHGYGVKGTNVIHKVHPNRRQRGGWLEHVKAASAKGGEMTEKERKERRRRILRRAIIASIGAGALAAPTYYAHRLNRAGEDVSRIHDETNPNLSLRQLEKELNKQEHLPKVRVGSISPLSLSRLLMRFKSGVPVYAQKHKGGYMNAAAVAKYDPNDPQKGFDRPFVLSLTTHPKILAHELGHVMDYKNGTFVRENFQRRKSRLKEAILTVLAPSKTTQMQNEIRAWDNAKVDASDPLRRAALGTYFAGQRMNLAKDLKGPVALSSAIALGYDVKRGKKKRKEEEEKKDEPASKGRKGS